MKKLTFFTASYHVTFQCGCYGIFKKFSKLYFAHENIKKLASKVAYIWQFGCFFFSAAPSAQKGKRMKIHIGNVSQDTSVL